jgi:predicted RNA binding protein YcfA (HicA-like mRNA interferase family)
VAGVAGMLAGVGGEWRPGWRGEARGCVGWLVVHRKGNHESRKVGKAGGRKEEGGEKVTREKNLSKSKTDVIGGNKPLGSPRDGGSHFFFVHHPSRKILVPIFRNSEIFSEPISATFPKSERIVGFGLVFLRDQTCNLKVARKLLEIFFLPHDRAVTYDIPKMATCAS